MCFGSAPQAPEVRYVGPSQADIDANNAKLDQYRRDSLTQQQQFASALQKQIDDANASAAALSLFISNDSNRSDRLTFFLRHIPPL